MKTVRKRTGPERRSRHAQRRAGNRFAEQQVFNKLLTKQHKLGIANYLLTRSPLGDMTGLGVDQDDRDLDNECGYPVTPTVDLYHQLYDREGIATRIVEVFPDECWSVYPQVYETEKDIRTGFERAWDKLCDDIDPLHYLHRADILSGIGHFGVLLLGLADGRSLDRPAPGINKKGLKSLKKTESRNKLIYLMPFPEQLVRIVEFEKDPYNPRYRQPTMYALRMSDPTVESESTSLVSEMKEVVVHWSRILHIADNRKSSEVFGVPRMRPVLNRIFDIRKVLGSSAEMFWKGGFPGYTFETYPDIAAEAELNQEELELQIEEYVKGLKRYMANVGGSFKSLAPQVADPTNHLVQQVSVVCATLGVPLRIFMGSEAGHLASTQDAGTWNRRLGRRQRMYLTPKIIKPFIQRLVLLGVLPEPERILVNWLDLNSMSDLEKSKVALTKAQALMQYVTGGVETAFPLKEFLTFVLGMSVEEAEAVLLAVRGNTNMVSKEVWKKPEPASGLLKSKTKPQGGGRTGKAPRSAPGRRAAGSNA